MVVLLVATMVATLLGPVGEQSAAAQNIQTRVQVLHASPNLGKAEVNINYDEIVEEFEYGQVSDWLDFTPGAPRVTIIPDRGVNYDIFFDTVYPAPAGNDYYLIITDALVLAGVFATSPGPDQGARVRIVHGAVALPAVNVTASGTDTSFARRLAYPRSSDDTVVPAGTYDLEVTLAETGETVLTVPGMVLEDDTACVLVLIGQPGDENYPLELQPLPDTKP
jgi:hypothetical protein